MNESSKESYFRTAFRTRGKLSTASLLRLTVGSMELSMRLFKPAFSHYDMNACLESLSESLGLLVRPITFMFEPRHNKLSDVRTNVRTYVVTWFEHSRESDRPVPGPIWWEAWDTPSVKGPGAQ